MSASLSNDNPIPSVEGSDLENAKDTVVNNTSAAASAVANHPITQSVTNGPVAVNIKDQHAKTQAEFASLAASRTTPTTLAATGQSLTHYHSFFSNLLSWNNPRASGIAYGSIILFIFAARYLDILRYVFRLTWLTLGVAVLIEGAGKLLLSHGFISGARPKKYYTVSKETLDSLLGDVHELVNFFVIEAQRIVFVENLSATAAAFLGAFFSYYLIKIVPLWGLALISTSVLFLSPLVYKTNKELIDHHLANAQKAVSEQTEQVKQLASHHAAHAAESTKSLVGDYSSKAQELIGNARGRSVSPTASAKPVKTEAQVKKENVPTSYKSEDFPAAPKEDFKTKVPETKEEEPLIAT